MQKYYTLMYLHNGVRYYPPSSYISWQWTDDVMRARVYDNSKSAEKVLKQHVIDNDFFWKNNPNAHKIYNKPGIYSFNTIVVTEGNLEMLEHYLKYVRIQASKIENDNLMVQNIKDSCTNVLNYI